MPTQVNPRAVAVDRVAARRQLVLHDSLAFLTLITVTVVLFVVTLLLFQSFTSHRADLAQRWAQRGSADLNAGKPGEAIVALRTALSYAPGNRPDELLLAQALGEAGHLDEATNYFLELWDKEPGDGFTNLQLARLAAKKHNRNDAVNYYRASIYGTWSGDGVIRRTEVRLELARYLIAEHDLAAGRMELLIAAGNTPDSPGFDITLGSLLEQADDAADARTYYQKALAAQPDNAVALEAAGRLDYNAGEFRAAERLLARAARVQPASGKRKDDDTDTLLANARRILELMPSSNLPAHDRVDRIVADRSVAAKRFGDCKSQFGSAAHLPAPLQALNAQWSAPAGTAAPAALLRNPDLQDSTMQLVYETERDSAMLCSTATGDDALLLMLANTAGNSQPSDADDEAPAQGGDKH